MGTDWFTRFFAVCMGGIALTLFSVGCEVRAPGPPAVVIGAPAVVVGPSIEIVDEHGYHHHGYYDEHHAWHGGYEDEHHVHHDDAGDWHHH
jgi:hypothetical protein